MRAPFLGSVFQRGYLRYHGRFQLVRYHHEAGCWRIKKRWGGGGQKPKTSPSQHYLGGVVEHVKRQGNVDKASLIGQMSLRSRYAVTGMKFAAERASFQILVTNTTSKLEEEGWYIDEDGHSIFLSAQPTEQVSGTTSCSPRAKGGMSLVVDRSGKAGRAQPRMPCLQAWVHSGTRQTPFHSALRAQHAVHWFQSPISVLIAAGLSCFE